LDGVQVAAKLDLEQRPMRGLFGRRRHLLGRAERDRIRGDAGLRRRAAQQLPGPLARLLGLQVDQCAIERIAGGAGRHRGLQGLAVKPLGNGFTHDLKRFKRFFRCLVIAGIGHAFAAPHMTHMPYLRHNHHGLCFGAAADGEGTCDGKALDFHVKCRKMVGSHFNVWRFLNPALARRNQLWLVRAATTSFCNLFNGRGWVCVSQRVRNAQQKTPPTFGGVFLSDQ
jgi:hypothetical protein